MSLTRFAETAILLGGDQDASVLPPDWLTGKTNYRVLDADVARDREVATRFRRLFVMASASQLGKVAAAVSRASHLNRLAAFFVQSDDVDPEWVTFMLSEANLRVLRNLVVHHGSDVPARVFQAWALGAPHSFIADATLAGDALIVRDCNIQSHRIAFDAYPALASIPAAQRRQFDIEEDGYLLHWHAARVHLDLQAIRNAANPELRAGARAQQLREQSELGGAIRRLREQSDLTQADIEGLSERQLRRIEQGVAYASDEALDALAQAHAMTPEQYFDTITELLASGQSTVDTPPMRKHTARALLAHS